MQSSKGRSHFFEVFGFDSFTCYIVLLSDYKVSGTCMCRVFDVVEVFRVVMISLEHVD